MRLPASDVRRLFKQSSDRLCLAGVGLHCVMKRKYIISKTEVTIEIGSVRSIDCINP